MSEEDFLKHVFNNPKVCAASSKRRFTLTECDHFLEKLRLNPSGVKYVSQQHTSSVISVREEGQKTNHVVADGLITQQLNVPLAVLTADCLPVFMVSRTKPLIALIHAGWRGLRREILVEACLQILPMLERSLSSLQVIFGPAICEDCYSVGPEFREYFPNVYNAQKRTFSLRQEARRQLIDSGVSKDQIVDSGYCTSCQNNQFYSVRKEPGTRERIINVIALVG